MRVTFIKREISMNEKFAGRIAALMEEETLVIAK